MLTSPQITGISPFSSLSTFNCNGLNIPRGMFLGGRFYTAQPYQAPIHISYINGAHGTYLSTWGIADATGKELAVIYFYQNSAVGDIIGIDGQYAGCIKARNYNYCNSSVVSGGAAISTGDLAVFLQGIGSQYVLENDTLVWDICYCSVLAPNATVGPTFEQLLLPPDCGLASDMTGAYYISSRVVPNTDTALRVLRISGAPFNAANNYIDLSGAHVSILPLCVSGGVVSSGSLISGGMYSGGTSCGAAEDILGAVVDGAVVLATHKEYPEQ